MKLRVVVLPALGTNEALVQIQTDTGVMLVSFDVNETCNNLIVTSRLFDGDEHTFARSLNDFPEIKG